MIALVTVDKRKLRLGDHRGGARADLRHAGRQYTAPARHQRAQGRQQPAQGMEMYNHSDHWLAV